MTCIAPDACRPCVGKGGIRASRLFRRIENRDEASRPSGELGLTGVGTLRMSTLAVAFGGIETLNIGGTCGWHDPYPVRKAGRTVRRWTGKRGRA